MSHAASEPLDERQVRIPEEHVLRRLPVLAGGVAAVALVAAVGMGFVFGDKKDFYFPWLVAFAYFLSIGIGGMFFVLVQHCARAGWSVVVRRVAENAMATVPFFALLFLPVIAGVHELYHWTHPGHGPHADLIRAKAPYLNIPFFLIRAVIYFTCWTVIARYFWRNSVKQDETGDPAHTIKMQWASGIALVVFGFTVTFAAFDWLMSLEPTWFSTLYGGYFFAGSVVAIFAFMTLCVLFLKGTGLMGDAVTDEHYHDLGKLMFAFTVFWAYLAFSQFMLIWYGNIPEETHWYMDRTEGGWKIVSMFLLFGHFIIPFGFLMPMTLKRRPVALFAGAAWLLMIHYVDIYWLVMPTATHGHGFHLTFGVVVQALAAFIAVGGAFLALFAWLTTKSAVLPVKDPYLDESRKFENYPTTA